MAVPQNSILSCCTTQTNTTPPCHRTTRLPPFINKTKAISYLRTTRQHYLTTSHPLSRHYPTLPYPTLPHRHLFLSHVLRRCSTFIFIHDDIIDHLLASFSSCEYEHGGPTQIQHGTSSSSAGTSRYNSRNGILSTIHVSSSGILHRYHQSQ